MSARNETPHVIIQTLGQKKCNGDWDASTENLSMEQVKQVAEKVGISESAARNRLIKSKNPDVIFAPQSSNGGGKKKKVQYKRVNKRPIEDPMFRLALKSIGGKPH